MFPPKVNYILQLLNLYNLKKLINVENLIDENKVFQKIVCPFCKSENNFCISLVEESNIYWFWCNNCNFYGDSIHFLGKFWNISLKDVFYKLKIIFGESRENNLFDEKNLLLYKKYVCEKFEKIKKFLLNGNNLFLNNINNFSFNLLNQNFGFNNVCISKSRWEKLFGGNEKNVLVGYGKESECNKIKLLHEKNKVKCKEFVFFPFYKLPFLFSGGYKIGFDEKENKIIKNFRTCMTHLGVRQYKNVRSVGLWGYNNVINNNFIFDNVTNENIIFLFHNKFILHVFKLLLINYKVSNLNVIPVGCYCYDNMVLEKNKELVPLVTNLYSLYPIIEENKKVILVSDKLDGFNISCSNLFGWNIFLVKNEFKSKNLLSLPQYEVINLLKKFYKNSKSWEYYVNKQYRGADREGGKGTIKNVYNLLSLFEEINYIYGIDVSELVDKCKLKGKNCYLNFCLLDGNNFHIDENKQIVVYNKKLYLKKYKNNINYKNILLCDIFLQIKNIIKFSNLCTFYVITLYCNGNKITFISESKLFEKNCENIIIDICNFYFSYRPYFHYKFKNKFLDFFVKFYKPCNYVFEINKNENNENNENLVINSKKVVKVSYFSERGKKIISNFYKIWKNEKNLFNVNLLNLVIPNHILKEVDEILNFLVG